MQLVEQRQEQESIVEKITFSEQPKQTAIVKPEDIKREQTNQEKVDIYDSLKPGFNHLLE